MDRRSSASLSSLFTTPIPSLEKILWTDVATFKANGRVITDSCLHGRYVSHIKLCARSDSLAFLQTAVKDAVIQKARCSADKFFVKLFAKFLSRKRESGSEDAGQQPEQHCPFVLLAGCKYSYITLELGKNVGEDIVSTCACMYVYIYIVRITR
jgi:hypothetical protein